MAEVAVARATRQHKVVIPDLEFAAEHDPLLQIDALDASEVNVDVRHVPELGADRNRDVRGVETRRRDLVQERLKQMMVPLVDKDDVDARRIRQLLRSVQASEAATDDHHNLFARCACRALKSHKSSQLPLRVAGRRPAAG